MQNPPLPSETLNHQLNHHRLAVLIVSPQRRRDAPHIINHARRATDDNYRAAYLLAQLLRQHPLHVEALAHSHRHLNIPPTPLRHGTLMVAAIELHPLHLSDQRPRPCAPEQLLCPQRPARRVEAIQCRQDARDANTTSDAQEVGVFMCRLGVVFLQKRHLLIVRPLHKHGDAAWLRALGRQESRQAALPSNEDGDASLFTCRDGAAIRL